jgi:hypothetical protein
VFLRWDRADQNQAVLSELARLRERDPKGFLNRIFAMNYGCREVGFKILKGQSKAVFDAIFNDRSIKKVVLFRRNVLANYSSKLIAGQSGKYALRKKDDDRAEPRAPVVTFDKNEFLKFSRKYNRYYDGVMSKLSESGQYYHLINYEDINEPEFFGNLLRFLDSEGSDKNSKGRNIKQNPNHIVSRFSNAGTVEDFLRRLDLMHWAYEGELSLGPLKDATGREGKSRKPSQQEASPTTGDSPV